MEGNSALNITTDAWRETLIDNLLHSIRFRSSAYYRPELRAPWGFSIGHRGPTFHIVSHGKCWLEVKGVAKPVQLSAGDFAVIPRSDLHVIRDSPTTRVVDYFDFLKGRVPDKQGAFSAGGEGPGSRLVCGGMQSENGATNPLLAVLPPLLHVKGRGEDIAPWIRATVSHLFEELGSGRAGAAEVVTRLADILFMQVVRAYLDENIDTAESGWLAALRDQQIGRALALLHDQPHQPWTVNVLADRVALSRSAFADKFTKLVGETPLRYLTRLRLNAATARLRSGNDKLSVIAAAAGYESVPAFTKAFKRHLVVTPGEYRRSHQKRGSG
jgi:AraC-like DNA-binding protein